MPVSATSMLGETAMSPLFDLSGTNTQEDEPLETGHLPTAAVTESNKAATSQRSTSSTVSTPTVVAKKISPATDNSESVETSASPTASEEFTSTTTSTQSVVIIPIPVSTPVWGKARRYATGVTGSIVPDYNLRILESAVVRGVAHVNSL